MDEHVLNGNSAILKCHIPSFVSDFVTIDAWIDEETGNEFRYDHAGVSSLGSRYFIVKFSMLNFKNFVHNFEYF